MRRPLATALAAGALTLLLTPSAMAHAETVADPDEASVPAHLDLEWATVEHPPSLSGRVVRHTIKTRAPYTRRPCLSVVTGGSSSYQMCGPSVNLPGGGSTAVWVTESPAAAPDTVSYTFDLAWIGNPSSYLWSFHTRPIADYLPDKPARILHSVPVFPGPVAWS